MTNDEKEFAQLIDAFEVAKKKFDEANTRKKREPIYEKEEGKYHTPTSMGNYRRAQAEQEAAVQAAIDAMEETAQAVRALDAWIPEPVHERLNKGLYITAPTAGGLVGLGKLESGNYHVLYAPNQELLSQKIREHALMNPRSDEVA